MVVEVHIGRNECVHAQTYLSNFLCRDDGLGKARAFWMICVHISPDVSFCHGGSLVELIFTLLESLQVLQRQGEKDYFIIFFDGSICLPSERVEREKKYHIFWLIHAARAPEVKVFAQ